MAQRHLDELDKLLGGFFVKYQPLLALMIGLNETLVLCNLIYWHSRPSRAGSGWLYKTGAEMYHETGLKRAAQDLAVKKLMKLGYLELKHGVLNKRMFSVNFDLLMADIPSLLESNKLDWLVKKNKSALNRQTTTKSFQRLNNKDIEINSFRPRMHSSGVEKISSVIARRNNFKPP